MCLQGFTFFTHPFQQLPSRTGGEQRVCLCVLNPRRIQGFLNCATLLNHEDGTESILTPSK